MFELGKVKRTQCVRFRYDRNEIDTSAETLHDFDIEGLEGVASGTDEIKAGVDAEINLLRSTRLLLL